MDPNFITSEFLEYFKKWTAKRNDKLVYSNVSIISNQSYITEITFGLDLLPICLNPTQPIQLVRFENIKDALGK